MDLVHTDDNFKSIRKRKGYEPIIDVNPKNMRQKILLKKQKIDHFNFHIKKN